MLTLYSPDFEVISKKKVFTIQRADFTRKWPIAAFGLFQIDLILFMCTLGLGWWGRMHSPPPIFLQIRCWPWLLHYVHKKVK